MLNKTKNSFKYSTKALSYETPQLIVSLFFILPLLDPKFTFKLYQYYHVSKIKMGLMDLKLYTD